MRWMVTALLLLVASCGADEPTQLDVMVDAGDSLRTLIATVAVSTRGGVDVASDEAPPTSTHVFGADSEISWPLHVVVAPKGGDASRELVADFEARDASGAVLARARIHGAFTEDRRVRVDLELADCCAGATLCSDQELDGEATLVMAELSCDPSVAAAAPTVAPSPLHPDNGASTGSIHAESSLTPRFVWNEVAGATHYELALSEDCSIDAYPECAFSGARVQTVAASQVVLAEPLSASTSAPVGARWVWRVRACNAGGCGPWSATRYLDVGRLPNDADGDGYSDLFVGASGAESAYLFRGSATGLELTPSGQTVVDDTSDEVGAAVAIGDLDGDGNAEMIVGAPGGEGRVYVFEGASGDLMLTHQLSPPMADGAAGFGAALAIADIDGDGRRDLVIGAPRGTEGAAYVVHWTGDGPGDPVRLSPSAAPAPELGGSVQNLGDVDGDGIDDVFVVAAGGATPEAHLFLGSSDSVPSESALVLSSGAGRSEDGYAASAARVGDLDGDGAAEIAVGADMMGEGGAILLYWSTRYPERFGSPELLRDRVSGDRYGTSVVGVADLDGDGRDEVLVGASGATSAGMAGAGLVYLLKSTDLEAVGNAIELVGVQPGAGFGASLASAGDVDGDGLSEIAVAAPGWDGGDGRVFLLPGGIRRARRADRRSRAEPRRRLRRLALHSLRTGPKELSAPRVVREEAMRKRKKSGAAPLPKAIERPRAITPGRGPAASYPSAREALASESCRALVDKAVRLAAGAGILALGSQLAACAEPTCEATPYGELEYHAGLAYDAALRDQEYRFAAEELGIATGVVTHPAFHPGAIAGAMPMPSTSLGGGPGSVEDVVELLGVDEDVELPESDETK